MKKIIKILLFLLLTIFLLVLYARFIGTAGLTTKEYVVYSEDISPMFDGLKIVHFSDLHYGQAISSEKVNKVIKEINLVNPDIVVFTGDLIDELAILDEKDYNFLENELNKINAKYGKYAVMGNHDKKNWDDILRIYNNSNFKFLENGHETIYDTDGKKINILGLGNVSHNLNDVDKTFDNVDLNDSFNLLLLHEPDIVSEIVDNYDVSLILGGHSHNGQVRLPFIGALYTPNGAKRYFDEYYLVDNIPLYISSGIGTSMLNYRLFNRPSINFYRINKK